MIFRHFTDSRQNRNSYLIASSTSREAAIIDPLESCLADYEAVLDKRGLRLVYTFQTHEDRHETVAAETLRMRRASIQVGPLRATAVEDRQATHVDEVAKPGSSFSLGELKVEAVAPPRGAECEVAYRVCDYTFAPNRVWIHDSVTGPNAQVQPGFVVQGSCQGTQPTRRPSGLVANERSTRAGVPVERLILEDLHTSLIEKRFSPKEDRIVRTYLEYLEDNEFNHPAAAQLSGQLGDVDRTAVHVLVHNIRWKQIDLDRLPVVLSGQTSKWLRELQTEPQFTDHEKEFLGAYLKLVERNERPPSGPDVAGELSGERSVQWIRKRAHTIRRKQKEFDQPVLILSRKMPLPQTAQRYLTSMRPTPQSNEDARWTA